MEIFIARVRIALFLLVLLFAFGCGRFDEMVAGMQGNLNSSGGGNAAGGSPGHSGGGNANQFPSSCSNILGRFVKSVPIEISQIALSQSQGSADFVIDKEITMEGLDMARALDKALKDAGPIAEAKYNFIILKVKGASLILKEKWGSKQIDIHSASGELRIKLTPEYVVSAEGKKGRILFDLCKNLVLQGPGRGDDDKREDEDGRRNDDTDNDEPKGCTLTPEIKGKVVYP